MSADFAVKQSQLDGLIKGFSGIKGEADAIGKASALDSVGHQGMLDAVDDFDKHFNSLKNKYVAKTSDIVNFLQQVSKDSTAADNSMASAVDVENSNKGNTTKDGFGGGGGGGAIPANKKGDPKKGGFGGGGGGGAIPASSESGSHYNSAAAIQFRRLGRPISR